MLTLCAIASGSNGNCYFIGNSHEAILVDAGLSARQTIARMHQQHLDPGKLKAIFITHEHSDHTCGARVLAKKLNIPVFITSRTLAAMRAHQKPLYPKLFKPGQEIAIGSLAVIPFLKNHDAAEPCSFRISFEGIHVGVFTDIGIPCENLRHHFRLCHAIFLETNYDEKMLWEGHYTWPLKRRIASDHGHLSNDQAFELLKECSGNQLQTVFLSHLSADNNTPEKAMQRFAELSKKYNIRLTSRYHAGDVVNIEYNAANRVPQIRQGTLFDIT